MKKLILALLLLAGTAGGLTAMPSTLVDVQSVPISPAAAAMRAELDAAWLRLGPQPAGYWAGKTNTQIAQEREDAERKVRELAERFPREHPTDPLRWEPILKASMLHPGFVAGFKPGFDEAPKNSNKMEFYIIDEPAKAAWTVQADAYAAALRAAPDVPWEILEFRLFLDVHEATRGAARNGPAAVGVAERRIDAFAARFPTGKKALQLYANLFAARLQAGGDAAEEIWGRLSANPNQAVAARAEAELRKIDAARKPFELAFTAVDGRAVDLAKLRGKVVLVDFWATWCGPCIAELPNVKKVYEAYHDKGFEVVGIALENGQLKTADTPEQAAAKLEKAKQVLTDFTTKENMPWPQYFDGKWWKNDISTRYAISAIPAMFLIDQEGRIVTTNARGAKLEQEVKRLLKL